MKIKLNRARIGEVLKGDEVRDFLHKVADPIAAEVALNPAVTRTEDATVYTEDYTTDRAAVAVMLDSVNGVPLEARYRVIRGTAEAAGLRVDGEIAQSLTYTTKAGKRRKASAAQIANWTRGSRS